MNFNSGTVTGNRARWGGGFYLFGGGTLNLSGGNLAGNIAENETDDGRISAGGGVYSDNGNIRSPAQPLPEIKPTGAADSILHQVRSLR